jgi:Baseplate J-like protein
MSYSYDLPVTITSAGAQPTPPATLQSQEMAYVTANDPGVTSNLPGLLIEDISDTNVGAMVVLDAARVDTLNSLSPNVANVALLNQFGEVYGVSQNGPTYTSVPVIFSGTVGYVIPAGFLVSDGTHTYQVQDGGPIGSAGSSAAMTAIAVTSGSWAVPANTVTQLKSIYPPTITLSVNNTSAGTAGSTTPESYSSYRQRVVQAGLAACVGTPRFIKTQVCARAALAANAVSVQQASPSGIRVIVVGGDIYQVAYAIFTSVADVTELVGHAAGGTDTTASLIDFPNPYSVLFVAAVAQTFSALATWNTTVSSFTGGGAFQGLIQQPISDYINSLAPGQVINLLEMNNIFQTATAGVLDPALLTRLVWAISINGTPVSPGSGESYIAGDAEGYFSCSPSDITAIQG